MPQDINMVSKYNFLIVILNCLFFKAQGQLDGCKTQYLYIPCHDVQKIIVVQNEMLFNLQDSSILAGFYLYVFEQKHNCSKMLADPFPRKFEL